MDQDKNIGLVFKAVAEKNADFEAIVFEDLVVTYDQLWRLVSAFALNMRGHGVNREAVVAVNTEDTLVILASLLASSLLGAQWTHNSETLKIAEVISPTHIFHSIDTVETADNDSVLIDEKWSPSACDKAALSREIYEGYKNADDPWLLVHTSGTTGFPKYFALSQRIVFDRSMAVKSDFLGQETRFCSLFSSHSRPFFARAIAALLQGTTIVESVNPDFWHKSGVNMVCGSRTQVMEVLKGGPIKPKSPMLEVSGSTLADGDAKIMLQSFETLVDIYGASETNKSFANIKRLNEDGDIITVGNQLDVEVQIVDEKNVPCDVGVLGIVRVKNPYMISNYINEPEADKIAFRDGWFYPGDIARWGENNDLQVLGRSDHIVNLNGEKINARMVEMVLSETNGIKDAVCFKNPKDGAVDELFAFVVFDGTVNKLQAVASAKYYCKKKLGKTMTPRVIQEINEIPRTKIGTPDRKACEHLVLQRSREMSEK